MTLLIRSDPHLKKIMINKHLKKLSLSYDPRYHKPCNEDNNCFIIHGIKYPNMKILKIYDKPKRCFIDGKWYLYMVHNLHRLSDNEYKVTQTSDLIT